MTKLLEEAMTEVKKLPDPEQDAIAAFILEEIQDEALWDKAFKKSQDALAKLATQALAEDRAGKTKNLAYASNKSIPDYRFTRFE